MRPDQDGGPAGSGGVGGPGASAVLAVADGLRRRDPQLSAALAEHAVRLAEADPGVRASAERSAVVALGQLDRGAEVVVRALPLLRSAERDARTEDAGALRCELASAALRCGAVDAAEALVGPVLERDDLPAVVRAEAHLGRARVRAERADVGGTDEAVRRAETAVAGLPADGSTLRIDLERARARARHRAGDPGGALELLRALPVCSPSGGVEVDAGRRGALVVADQIDILLDLQRPSAARATAVEALTWIPTASTALALGRLRCALAARVHLPSHELDRADSLARAAEKDLTEHGHESEAAAALEVVAAVAEARGDLGGALSAVRRAHALENRARETATLARVALASVVADPATTGAALEQATRTTSIADAGSLPTAVDSGTRSAGAEARTPSAGVRTAVTGVDTPAGWPETPPAARVETAAAALRASEQSEGATGPTSVSSGEATPGGRRHARPADGDGASPPASVAAAPRRTRAERRAQEEAALAASAGAAEGAAGPTDVLPGADPSGADPSGADLPDPGLPDPGLPDPGLPGPDLQAANLRDVDLLDTGLVVAGLPGVGDALLDMGSSDSTSYDAISEGAELPAAGSPLPGDDPDDDLASWNGDRRRRPAGRRPHEDADGPAGVASGELISDGLAAPAHEPGSAFDGPSPEAVGARWGGDPLEREDENVRRMRRARERWESAASLLPRHRDPADPATSDRRSASPEEEHRRGASDLHRPASGPAAGPRGEQDRRWETGGDVPATSVVGEGGDVLTGGSTSSPDGREDPLGARSASAPDAIGRDRGVDGLGDLSDELALTLIGLLAEYDEEELPGGASRTLPGSGEVRTSAWTFDPASLPGQAGPIDRPRLDSPVATPWPSDGWGRGGNGGGPLGGGTNGGGYQGGGSQGGGPYGGRTHGGGTHGGRPAPDSGERLADLLADAMDAFRRSGPSGPNGPGRPGADDRRPSRR